MTSGMTPAQEAPSSTTRQATSAQMSPIGATVALHGPHQERQLAQGRPLLFGDERGAGGIGRPLPGKQPSLWRKRSSVRREARCSRSSPSSSSGVESSPPSRSGVQPFSNATSCSGRTCRGPSSWSSDVPRGRAGHEAEQRARIEGSLGGRPGAWSASLGRFRLRFQNTERKARDATSLTGRLFLERVREHPTPRVRRARGCPRRPELRAWQPDVTIR